MSEVAPGELVGTFEGSPTDWAYRTRRFRILGYDFAFRSTDNELGQYLDEMFDACVEPGEPTTWYSVVSGLKGESSLMVFRNCSVIMSCSWPGIVSKVLTSDINRRAIERGKESHVILHAGVVAREGRALLLPAAMEAGKTTLVAGLLRVGFDYLTDEAAAIDPTTYYVEPFPKPLSIDRGSWGLFPEISRLKWTTSDYATEQWQVSPSTFPAYRQPISAPIVYIVFPQYVPGSSTMLREVAPTTALIRLLQQAFGFREQIERNLETLGRLVERTEVYELTVGQLERACELIGELYRLPGSAPVSSLTVQP